MIGSIEQEKEILETVLSYRNDPLSFALWSYPWGEAGTPFAGIKEPRAWQIEELERYGDHLKAQEFAEANGLPPVVYKAAYSSGRGPGKSALGGIISHHQISTHIGSMAVVVANTESQLRGTTFPEFSKWFTSAVNQHWFDVDGMKIAIQPWLATIAAKHPSQGGRGIDAEKWLVKGKTWVKDNPNAYAGEHNDYGLFVFFDEAAGIESFVWDLTDGFFTEVNPYRAWMAASQMRNRAGRFFEIFNDEKMGKGWRQRTISTRGMDNVDQIVVEDQIERYGEDSDFVRVEVMGLPPRTSEDQFIPWDAVRAAQQNELHRDYYEPLIMGVDPAPRGRTVIRFRQGRNARDCCGSSTVTVLEGADNVVIAEKVLALDFKFKPDAICIDFGMGTGVIDIVKRKRTHGRLHEVKFGATCSKDSEWGAHGTELWAKLRDWLPGGMIAKDDGAKGTLSYQMTNRGWRWSGREDNKKILETKEDLQGRGVKSPDDVDALACTFEVNPPRSDYVRSPGEGRVAEGVSKSMTD